MGILNQTQYDYYNEPSNFGNYQFTSLNDVINQFMVAYVGEEKIIGKASRTDVQFHAMRALAELSFDTFKSIKSQEIELPPSLTMILPHDYVNYTRVLCVDNAGIKQPLYPTKHTQNPFKILQDEDKSYDFIVPSTTLLNNGDFKESIPNPNASGEDWNKTPAFLGSSSTTSTDKVHVVNERLVFEHGSTAPIQQTTNTTSRAYACWQKVNVEGIDLIDISALGKSAAAVTGKGVGTLRVGISTLTYPGFNPITSNPNLASGPSLNNTDEIFDLYLTNGDRAVMTFNDGLNTSSTKTLTDVDVSSETEVFVLITSFIENFTDNTLTNSENIVDDVVISCDALSKILIEGGESTTWGNYKSARPSENKQHDYDYDDHIFEANVGRRYGLEPSHAQDNGSYYVDNLRGKINFSSNLSGKTIVLDYISDSLGTDAEMQVHKFAEEAMYKSIMYAILSTRANTPEYIVRRYKKERFAEIRKAKLRLSNIKLEEITQIFRGKSKHIKH
mgnify:FL=1|jgi:hypothetical protein|tara:strand:+ start:461 stop:1969 length:1509 start_codon:yes stop_codon:yes gene_type:complete